MNTKKSLAKVFGPVLLLTATLALPIDTAQAAPGNGRGHVQAEQHNKNKKDKQKHEQRRTEVRRQQRQPQHRQQVVVQQRSERPKVQKKVKKVVVQQPVVVQRRPVVRTQDVRRQEALRLQAQRQQAYQRQQALERQRALDRQRALARQRQAPVYRDGRRYDDRYYATPRRGGGGADPNVFHIDGYLDDGGECLFLRDHEGRTWAMVGNTYGLQPGEHVRLYGRPVDGSACGYRGAAFDIYEVRTVWADNNHKRTYYDHLYDGPFDQNRAYEDDRYYNDRYEEDRDADSWWERLFGG